MYAEHTDRCEDLEKPCAISNRETERTEHRSVKKYSDHWGGIEEVQEAHWMSVLLTAGARIPQDTMAWHPPRARVHHLEMRQPQPEISDTHRAKNHAKER